MAEHEDPQVDEEPAFLDDPDRSGRPGPAFEVRVEYDNAGAPRGRSS